MTGNIHEAAHRLHGLIPAPSGAVNTLAWEDAEHGEVVIRVLVDPLYWFSVRDIPSIFDGYRVTVEKREPTVSFH